MRIAIFGSHGPTGLLLTNSVLEAGHEAIAVTRQPAEFPITVDGLSVVGADATSADAVSNAISGADAVVSTLGSAFSRRPITVYSQFAHAIVPAMNRQGLRRLIVTSSAAVDPWTDPDWNWGERVIASCLLPVLGRTLYADMRSMEAIVAASDLDWTIVRPLGLVNLDSTGYRVAAQHLSGRQTARSDLAAAITDQLNRTDYYRKIAFVASGGCTQSIAKTIWREGIRPKLIGN